MSNYGERRLTFELGEKHLFFSCTDTILLMPQYETKGGLSGK